MKESVASNKFIKNFEYQWIQKGLSKQSFWKERSESFRRT
jgi:hypothetical protein